MKVNTGKAAASESEVGRGFVAVIHLQASIVHVTETSEIQEFGSLTSR